MHNEPDISSYPSTEWNEYNLNANNYKIDQI